VGTRTRYTVELRLPRTGWADLQEAAARARQATEQMQREGEQVRFLRSIFVPEDDACFFLYEGTSARSVRAAATRAKLGVRRIDAALRLDLDEGEETS
jgi:2-succinyl-5-enolpyruvyl-6-hydroxy-3-cyclohexene-1-carboxylate synthase